MYYDDQYYYTHIILPPMQPIVISFRNNSPIFPPSPTISVGRVGVKNTLELPKNLNQHCGISIEMK